MGFPTVKSDPWKKGLRPRRQFMLWPGKFWKRLVEACLVDAELALGSLLVDMISEMNLEMYGKR